jgi:hypothetical protein
METRFPSEKDEAVKKPLIREHTIFPIMDFKEREHGEK